MSFLILLLVPMAEVELVFFRSWSHYWSKRWCFFFSFQAFLLEVLLLPAGKELDSFGAENDVGFSTGLLQEFRIEDACDLAIVEWPGRLPRGQRWSISRRINGDYKLAFASALIAFLISFSQLLCLWPRCSIWAFIDGLRPLQKN